MIITCPYCKARYAISKIPSNIDKVRVTCKKCLSYFIVSLEIANISSPKTVLIAHDDVRVITLIKKILEKEDFIIDVAHDGLSALAILKEKKPLAAIVDVALPGIFGFELCEKIKNDPELKKTKIILVASIYDRTRYKRKPQNLYGADDYIEKHHIPDELLPKLIKHISGKELAPKVEKTIEHKIAKEVLKDNRDILLDEKNIDIERNKIKQHESDYLQEIKNVPERAKKLARLIVSDIALYNQDKIGLVNSDNFYQHLKIDIDDGISHLSKKIPEAAKEAKNLIHQAMRELLNKRCLK